MDLVTLITKSETPDEKDDTGAGASISKILLHSLEPQQIQGAPFPLHVRSSEVQDSTRPSDSDRDPSTTAATSYL
ncbi:hypothetical protein TNCV_1925951 [Trichonephila clavipes]|nr:hypothetical protein TNCV_1925951 [Trichonephila clavipes]